MNTSYDVQGEGLIRAIGVRALGMNVVNMVVGGGIFVLPGVIAVQLGPAAIVAYLICSIAVARTPTTSGPFVMQCQSWKRLEVRCL